MYAKWLDSRILGKMADNEPRSGRTYRFPCDSSTDLIEYTTDNVHTSLGTPVSCLIGADTNAPSPLQTSLSECRVLLHRLPDELLVATPRTSITKQVTARKSSPAISADNPTTLPHNGRLTRKQIMSGCWLTDIEIRYD